MRIAIYSSIGNKKGQDTENQLAQLRRYALSQDREVRLFVDCESGKTCDRAEFQKLFEAAPHREFQVCWCGPWIASWAKVWPRSS